jgi:hypothetical protein
MWRISTALPMFSPHRLRRVRSAIPRQSNGYGLPLRTTTPRSLADLPVRTDLEKGMANSVPRRKGAYTQLERTDVVTLGVFHFAGDVPVGKIADFYGLPVAQADKATRVGDFIADRLRAEPAVGDSIGIGMIGLIVHDVSGERITGVGLELSSQGT